jgi:GMP synthase-like glutamine amidotransferase
MHLAVLVTNTDESAFAQRHPKDGEKFPAMLRTVRPNWRFEAFAVKDGVFPDDPSRFDGVIITGSPASVHDGFAWIERLMGTIRTLVAHKTPLFGACFGHQAIALALGGRVERNPDGWVHGLTMNDVTGRAPWLAPLPSPVRLYGSHAEHVAALPDGAILLMTARDGLNAGYRIGDHVYTTQHHPEMTPGFIAALTEELADALGPDFAARARASLTERADSRAFAESVALFFETASARMV